MPIDQKYPYMSCQYILFFANTYYFLPIHTIFYPKQFGHRPTPNPNINTVNCCPSNNVCFRKCIKQSNLWHQGLQT